MVVTPDNRTLIVAESFAGRLTAFDIDDDGTLSKRLTAREAEPVELDPPLHLAAFADTRAVVGVVCGGRPDAAVGIEADAVRSDPVRPWGVRSVRPILERCPAAASTTRSRLGQQRRER